MYNCLTGYKSINERKKIPKKKMRKVQNSENACLLETSENIPLVLFLILVNPMFKT